VVELQAISALRAHLADPVPRVEVAVRAALLLLGDKAQREPLGALKSHSDAEVRRMAEEALSAPKR
jgi:hypothetical protein